MAGIVVAYIVTAGMIKAYIGTAYIVTAYIVTAYIVTAYIVSLKRSGRSFRSNVLEHFQFEQITDNGHLSIQLWRR